VQAATALGTDVGWTRVITDLGKSMPGGVWMTSFQASHTLATAKAGAARPAAAGAAGGATATAGGTGGAAPTGGAASTNAAGTAGGEGTVAGPGGSSCTGYEGALTGTVTINGIAKDVPSLSTFMDNAAKAGNAENPDLLSVWLVNAQKAKFGTTDVITFSVSATLAPGARSDRLETYFKGAVCSK
jgi:hypothetical protein